MIKMPKKDEYVRFKNYKNKIKQPFMIYVNFKSISVPEYSKYQNPDVTYMNKYQKHVACSYSYMNYRAFMINLVSLLSYS